MFPLLKRMALNSCRYITEKWFSKLLLLGNLSKTAGQSLFLSLCEVDLISFDMLSAMFALCLIFIGWNAKAMRQLLESPAFALIYHWTQWLVFNTIHIVLKISPTAEMSCKLYDLRNWLVNFLEFSVASLLGFVQLCVHGWLAICFVQLGI